MKSLLLAASTHQKKALRKSEKNVELCLGSWKSKTLSEYQERIISFLASATKAVITIKQTESS